jgi:hypothetical protein
MVVAMNVSIHWHIIGSLPTGNICITSSTSRSRVSRQALPIAAAHAKLLEDKYIIED